MVRLNLHSREAEQRNKNVFIGWGLKKVCDIDIFCRLAGQLLFERCGLGKRRIGQVEYSDSALAWHPSRMRKLWRSNLGGRTILTAVSGCLCFAATVTAGVWTLEAATNRSSMIFPRS